MKIPLIKEKRIEKIVECLKCIDRYAYNREKIKECILRLYPGKSEKSVFRGMVIPSLRRLGLILGYGGFIRVGANGKLILKSQNAGEKEFKRVLRAVFFEIDNQYFRFIIELKKFGRFHVPYDEFLEQMIEKVEGPSIKQKKERIVNWLKMIEQCTLIKTKNKNISLISKNIDEAKYELNFKRKKNFFKEYLFESYSALAPQSAGIVDIADLRAEIALKIYSERKEILTEAQFDNLLRDMPMVTEEYIISLGQPMGAEEKLFKHDENYYRTISIKIFPKKEKG
jgi:hypothetical protein